MGYRPWGHKELAMTERISIAQHVGIYKIMFIEESSPNCIQARLTNLNPFLSSDFPKWHFKTTY